jgi:hypothetical protein
MFFFQPVLMPTLTCEVKLRRYNLFSMAQNYNMPEIKIDFKNNHSCIDTKHSEGVNCHHMALELEDLAEHILQHNTHHCAALNNDPELHLFSVPRS